MKTCRRGLHTYDQNQARPGCQECKRITRREGMRRWRSENVDTARERDRQRYAAGPTRRLQSREGSQRWRDAHPEASRVQSLACKWKHIDEVRARVNRHRLANAPAYAEAQRRRRARKLATTVEPITQSQLRALAEAQGERCHYCAEPLTSERHLDHKTPLARGGSHAIDNLCWACAPCNRRKGTKTDAEFTAREAA